MRGAQRLQSPPTQRSLECEHDRTQRHALIGLIAYRVAECRIDRRDGATMMDRDQFERIGIEHRTARRARLCRRAILHPHRLCAERLANRRPVMVEQQVVVERYLQRPSIRVAQHQHARTRDVLAHSEAAPRQVGRNSRRRNVRAKLRMPIEFNYCAVMTARSGR